LFSPVRLLDYATNYFDLASFQNGETKQALQRVMNKRAGKAPGRVEGSSNSDNGPASKKRKKNKT
jgi:pre-mRNA-splicing factor ATP-dependent RNA helicase DHX15/PRP43